ncbi:MAG: MFS transporter [Novosphingobium sp.]|nr:MFS transporter [Novosphingobium sp.]
MSYLGEIRQNMRPLAAASIGSGTSLPLFAYTNSVFAPHLVEEFGWSRSQFALVGLTMLTTLFILPFVGRFTDKVGVFRIAIIGTIFVPICFLGYAAQQGAFWHFLVASTSILAIGSLTSPLVYTRLIAEKFERATGLALTIVNCVPALLAMAMVPALNWFIEDYGWRLGYIGLAIMTLIGGVTAILLIPPESRTIKREPKQAPDKPIAAGENVPDYPATAPVQFTAKQDYSSILSSKIFWLIFIGMFMCLLQTPLHASQMNLMLVDNEISMQTAANIVTVYALGTVVGRIACGLALDRYPTPIVTTLSMVLPALGFYLLATDINTVAIITFSMFLVGLSIGAESDLISYLVARYFKLRIYNTTLGLVYCVSFLASALGALAISFTLKLTDSFSPYLYFVAGSIAVGSLLFLLMPWSRDSEKVG